MRVSSLNLLDNRLIDVGLTAERFSQAQTRLGTGLRINKPSDDPRGIGESINLRAAAERIDQFLRNGADARGFMGSADKALEHAVVMLRQARVLAVQGANDTLDIQARNGLAAQVGDIIGQVAAVANSQYGSRYLFAGQRTTAPPFIASSGGYAYQGGSAATGDGDLLVEIAPTDKVAINSTGDTLFEEAFSSLADLRDNLSTAQSQDISTTDIAAIDAAIETLTTARAAIGSTVQRVQQTGARLEQTRLDLTTTISAIEDADIPRTVVELKTAETAYQSALAATAIGNQSSLLDFLK